MKSKDNGKGCQSSLRMYRRPRDPYPLLLVSQTKPKRRDLAPAHQEPLVQPNSKSDSPPKLFLVVAFHFLFFFL